MQTNNLLDIYGSFCRENKERDEIDAHATIESNNKKDENNHANNDNDIDNDHYGNDDDNDDDDRDNNGDDNNNDDNNDDDDDDNDNSNKQDNFQRIEQIFGRLNTENKRVSFFDNLRNNMLNRENSRLPFLFTNIQKDCYVVIHKREKII